MLKTKISLVVLLALLGALAWIALAQERKTIVIERSETEASVQAAPTVGEQSPSPPPFQRIMGEMRVAALATDAYIVVKDHGDSQTVMLYRVSEGGGMAMVHKARFLYNVQQAPQSPVPRLENTTTVEGKIDLSALSMNTFIVIKDHGFGQTSMSYKIDETNKIKLLHRQSFLY
ncbi:MAG: hypothetical protein Kow0090_01220 [Myxococcota bacterium]